jgi:starch phosphorylase
VPLFYHHDDDGIPRGWIARMKRAIQTLGPQYNSDRMVEEYARKIYPQITQIR